MSLRRRLAIISAAATALTAVAVAWFGYVIARNGVVNEVEEALRRDATRIARQIEPRMNANVTVLGSGPAFATSQVVNAAGEVSDSTFPLLLEPLPADRVVADGDRNERFSTRKLDGGHVKVITLWIPSALVGGSTPENNGDAITSLAVQVSRPIAATENRLRDLAVGFGVLGTTGTLLAGLAAALAARSAIKPVGRLAAVAEQIAMSGDLSHDAPEVGATELARLGKSFNTMLASLRASNEQQRQLVDDAAHELRTPLTSMRTNLDVLSRSAAATAEDRAEIIGDIRAQFDELQSLVGDLGVLASDAQTGIALARCDLAEVVRNALTRVRRRATDVAITEHLVSSWILGDVDQLERGTVNVIDNAIKWSPANGVVEVRVAAGVLTVLDRGPGVPEEFRTEVFERFWRTPDARETPGSGLGLAIVAKVAADHHGTVAIDTPPGGGTIVTLTIPVVA